MIVHLIWYILGAASYAFVAYVYTAFADYWRVRFFDDTGDTL